MRGLGPLDPIEVGKPPAISRARALLILVPHLTEFPSRVLLALGFLIGAKLAGVALPLVLKRLVDTLSHASLVAVPLGLLAAYGGLRFLSVLAGELRDVAFGRVTERAMRRSALRVFHHLHGLDLEFHLSRRTGALSRDIERGIEGIRFLLRFLLFNILPTLLEIVLVSAILWKKYDWRFALIAFGAVLSYITFSVWVTEWRIQYVRRLNQLDSSANAHAVDALINYETVKYFGNEAFEAERYDKSLSDWERAAAQNRVSLAALNVGQALIVAGGITLMMWLAMLRVDEGRMTVGDFVAVNAFMVQLFLPLNFLGFVYREVRRAVTDMQRMFGLLEASPTVADAVDGRTLSVSTTDIRFEHVSFAYDSQRGTLNDISFAVPAGKKVAVVGPSGAGKSTLARLLFRFYDVQGGCIRVAGHDIRQLTLRSLRAHIGVVPQDTVLFNESIYYNIAYGRPDAGRAEIERAAEIAHLTAFVNRLPARYETHVGERGLKLSGGEKQRIAIARAVLKNPPILILDEATSSLDSASEAAILEALRDATEHRTTLTIAHRLSTITDCDEILVLDHGRIVERGGHNALLAMNGVYAHMWQLQQRSRRETEQAS